MRLLAETSMLLTRVVPFILVVTADRAMAAERLVVTDVVVYHLGSLPGSPRELVARLAKDGPLTFWPDEKKGSFPGLTVRALKQGELPPPDPQYLQHFGRGLDPGLVKRLQASPNATLLTVWTKKGETVPAVREGQRFALKLAEATDGVLMDYQSRECFSRDAWRAARLESWKDDAPNASAQIAIHFYADQSGRYRSTTVGMVKFGLPDLVVEDHPASLAGFVADLLKLASQVILESKELDRKSLVLDADRLKQPVLDSKGTVVRAAPGAKIMLVLRPANRQEGDSDDLLEVTLGRPEQIVAVHDRAFGSGRDEVHTTRQGDPELEEASRRARDLLLASRAEPRGAADRREIWQAKGIFQASPRDAETLWFEIRRWENGVVSGPLTSVPTNAPLKKGETVSVRETEIFDFMRGLPDGTSRGGETDAILKRRAGIK